MKKTLIKALAMLTLTALLLTGCGAPATSQSSSATEPAASQSTTSTAPASSDSTIPVPEKIISLAPSNTQLLIALGLGDKLIAVDTYSAVLPGVPAGLPQFSMMTPDAEALVALQADIIITTGMSASKGTDPFKPVRDAGARIKDMETPGSIQGIRDGVLEIGAVVGKEAEAKALVAEMDATIARVAAIGSTITDKKKVYFEIAAAPSAYSFGGGVYLDEMLTLVGAENILAAETGWISVSEEAVLAGNPDVILTNVDYIENPVEEIKARAGWNGITAVQEGQVYFVDKNPTSLPNHTMTEGLLLVAKAIYPQQYKDVK